METGPYHTIRTMRELHKDVIPCVSAVKVPVLPRQVKLTDRSWPFVGSCVIHAVLFALVSSPAFHYPIVVRSQSPTTFWFSPISPPESSAAEKPLQSQSVAFAAPQEIVAAESISSSSVESDNSVPVVLPEAVPETNELSVPIALTVTAPAPVKKIIAGSGKPLKPPPETPRSTTPLPAPKQVEKVSVPLEAEPESEPVLPAIQPSRTRNVETVSEKEMQSKDDTISRRIIEQNQQAAEKLHREQLAREQEQRATGERMDREHIAAENERQNQQAAEKLRREQLAREQEQRATRERMDRERVAAEKDRQNQQAAEKLRREQLVREQEQQATQQRLEQERAVIEKNRQKQLVIDQELLKQKHREDALHKQKAESAAQVSAERALSTVARQNKPSPLQLKKTSEPQSPVKPPEKLIEKTIEKPIIAPVEKQTSVSLPFIKGDLKLVMVGSHLPGTTITFTEFAQSRRDRPLSRAEARRSIKISPLIAHIRETTREVVIAHAGQGIYTITAESSNDPAHVAVSLKLYEGSSRAAARELGSYTISRKKVLLKILMPEGIMWEDNSAFSGNMEDSDGVTKFNTETGLMWKEYTE